MAEYRVARPEEEQELLDLINFVFSQTARPHDFEKLIPKVYAHQGFCALHAVAVEEGRLRGTVALLPLSLQMGENTLRAGYVGSVAAHPRYRGRGYMRALMAFQERQARARGLDLLVLGGQRQRYQHFGFEKGGQVLCFYFTQGSARRALPECPAVTLEQVTGPEHPALPFMKALHDRQVSFCGRSDALFYETLCTYNQEPFAIVSKRSGGWAGYLVQMGDQITELALTEEAYLPDVLAAWMKNRKTGQVKCPGWHTGRARALDALAEKCAVSEEEMFLVLNWERVLGACLNFQARAKALAEGDRVIRVEDGGTFALTVRDGKASAVPTDARPDLCLTQREAVTRLFSSLSALLEEDPILKNWLPLPLYIPTADQF